MTRYTRSQLAQAFLYLRGEPIRFHHHPYMPGMLDSTHDDKLYKCSRQVGKSVTIGVELLIDPITEDLPVQGLREVYVAPRMETSKQFSVEKLFPMIYDSPAYRELYTDSNCRKDVFLYTFKPPSAHQIYLRAAYRSADAARGIPADKICVDEVQDILPSFLPDIMASSLASPYGKRLRCGTPKSEDNHMEEMWETSVQYEWAVPCRAHSPVHWNVPLTVDNIGKDCVVCASCKKPINPLEGTWVRVKERGFTEAYHINQLASSLNMKKEKWDNNIIKSYEEWSEDKFNNEVLGVSSGKAQQILLQEDMYKCLAQPTPLFDNSHLYDLPPRHDVHWFGGIDWGEGRDEGDVVNGKKHYASYTIFFIGAYDMYGKLNIAHYKKFKGREASPSFVVQYVIQKTEEWKIKKLAVDYGHGWGLIEQIVEAIGADRLFSIYESANLGALLKYKPKENQYVINRNEFIARMCNSIKRQEINFPKGSEDCFPDFTAVRTEYSEQQRQLSYIHRVNEPDDAVHALMYMKIAADLARGAIVPSK